MSDRQEIKGITIGKEILRDVSNRIAQATEPRVIVEVESVDNRVEVINPGTFPEGVSPDEPTHKPVNPTLSQLMFDVGFIERYGAGIRMMRRLCEEWGNKAPRYVFHPLETKIIFDSPIQESTFIEIDDISDQLNERQRNAFFYVQRHGQIATKKYVEINNVSRRVAYEELRDMTDKGLLFIINVSLIIGEVGNAHRMNQNQRYECLIGIHRVFMPYGMNRGVYAAKPRQRRGRFRAKIG